MSLLKVPRSSASIEIVLQRSRFLALGFPVGTQEEARQKLKEFKHQYFDATHVVHGFIIGREGSQITGSSDDGEPPGTAGRPVLEVLKGSGITGIFVAVVRYFGGVKLGTGGLVKAYTQAVQELLEVIPLKEDRDLVRGEITLGYSDYETLRRRWETWDLQPVQEDFGEKIRITFEMPRENLDPFKKAFGDITLGQGQFKRVD